MSTMKAVICAAGEGKRMLPITKNLHKALLIVGNKTILEHILDSVSSCNLTEVVIVVGYKGYLIEEKIGRRYKNCRIAYVYNKDFSATNNIYSLWLTKEHITDGMIFFNADTIFHQGILQNILRSEYPDSFIFDLHKKAEADSIKVHVEDGKLVEIGKKITKQVSGITFGMYKLSKTSSDTYFKTAEDLFKRKETNKNISFVVPLQMMAREVAIRAVVPNCCRWVEVDTPEDYEKAAELVTDILAD